MGALWHINYVVDVDTIINRLQFLLHDIEEMIVVPVGKLLVFKYAGGYFRLLPGPRWFGDGGDGTSSSYKVTHRNSSIFRKPTAGVLAKDAGWVRRVFLIIDHDKLEIEVRLFEG